MTDKSEMPAMYVIFVLDESGSMAHQREATIGGVNEYVQKLRKEHVGEKVLFSLVKFQSVVEPVYMAIPLEDVPEMTGKDYNPDNLTALYDGVGYAVNEMTKRIDDSEECDVLVVILTDGHNNDSKEFTYEQICKLIEARKQKEWSFVFMGADEKAWEVGQSLGVQSSIQYDPNDMGPVMQNVAASNTAYRYAKRSGADADRGSKVFQEAFDNIVKPDVPNIDMSDKWDDGEDASPDVSSAKSEDE
jgi:uncharacterized protein YegL